MANNEIKTMNKDTKFISVPVFSTCERMTTINFKGAKDEWVAINKKHIATQFVVRMDK